MEVSSGSGNPSCRGFNRQNVEETGSIERRGITGLFFCCLQISYEMAGSYSDVVKCLWLGIPPFHRADLMERRGVKRQRQIDKVYIVGDRGEVQPRSSDGSYIKTRSAPARLQILNPFQATAAHATIPRDIWLIS